MQTGTTEHSLPALRRGDYVIVGEIKNFELFEGYGGHVLKPIDGDRFQIRLDRDREGTLLDDPFHINCFPSQLQQVTAR